MPGSTTRRVPWLCREGKAALESYCGEKGIPLEHTGKLVVALTDAELRPLAALHERATANGVPGLELVGPERLREIEPHAAGIQGLWSPTTGIVDFRVVTLSYADDVRAAGGTIATSRRVTAIDDRNGSPVVRTADHGDVGARAVVVCAGLWADRIAAMTGDAGRDAPRIVPFRGDYYTLTPDARAANMACPTTPTTAVLAFARTGYRRRDVSVRDLLGTLTYPGFLRLATKYLRTGLAEMWRDWSKGAFLRQLQRYVPELRGDQIVFGPSGVRAQALGRDGTMIDDFDFAGSGRVLHVRNAPSPAATASLAIGRVIAERVGERLDS